MTEPAKHPEGPHIRLSLERDHRFQVRFESDQIPDLITDEPPPLGEGRGPRPVELLGAAVGNCLASSLLFCLRKARLDPASLDADVGVETVRNEDGRLRVSSVTVTLRPGLAPGEGERMERCLALFESFCLVTESVRQGFPVHVSVEAREAGSPSPSRASARSS